jgi:putative copper export protein
MNVLQVLLGWADLVATVVLIGGALYGAFVAEPEPRGRGGLRAAAWLLAAALLLEIGMNAFRMQQISGIGGLPLLADVFEMKWTRWWVLRSVALAAIAGGLTADRPRWGGLATVGIAALLARSLQGHAGAHGTTATLFDWVHLFAASVWVGGLVQLALSSSLPTASVMRASRLFTIALGPLLVAGAYGAFLHVASFALLVTSPYGRTLLAKMMLATLAIGLGATNHYRALPALRRDEVSRATRLLYTVRAEVAVVAVILLLSALLGSLPMPHAVAP